MHHWAILINHQHDATIIQFIILTFVYSSTCFGLLPAHHQEFNDCSGSLWVYLRIVATFVLCSWSGRPAQTQHDCHHDTKVKPEAATAVIELLMMGGKTPETCWPVNGRQDNKLENCCIWLVIYLNKRMTHTCCPIYRVVLPENEQQVYSKHVDVNYWNKLKVNSASRWFLL